MFKRRWQLVVGFVLLLMLAGLILRTGSERLAISWPEQIAFEAVAPLQRWASGLTGTVRGWFQALAELRDARRVNEELQAEVYRLQQEVAQLLEARRENEGLREMLGLVQKVSHEVTVAEIVARSPSNWLGSVTINRGRRDGVEPGMAVIAPGGVVGRVRNVTASTAEVLLITDSRSAVGGRVRDTNLPVLVEGTSRPVDQRVIVRPLDGDGKIEVGDVIVTSGLSRIYPKGLPIGEIVAVQQTEGSLAHQGILQPYVDFDRLEWVAVITLASDELSWHESGSGDDGADSAGEGASE